MKKTLAFLMVFSQPLIGVPIGLVLGTHAALYCEEPAITQCITEEIGLWTDKLSSLI